VLLALSVTAIVLLALLWELSRPKLRVLIAGWRDRRAAQRSATIAEGYDPGRELRAEQRARALLRSCVNDEEWAMYRELGFLRVWGGHSGAPMADTHATSSNATSTPDSDSTSNLLSTSTTNASSASIPGSVPAGRAGAPYAYLIYPHKPIVAYLPQTGVLLNEYCVTFPDLTRPYGSSRLPDSDDVLAKWMALTADERGLVASANMHLPGRQIDPEQVRRDLQRLSRWERERLARFAGNVPAP
jgi:hypothetical protein